MSPQDGPRGISLESLGVSSLPSEWPRDQKEWTPAMHEAYEEFMRGKVAGWAEHSRRLAEYTQERARQHQERRAAWEADAPVRNARRRELLRELVQIDHGGHWERPEPDRALEAYVLVLEDLDFVTLGGDEYHRRLEESEHEE